jgi:DNA-directed RNA polymerase II subunit RPB2
LSSYNKTISEENKIEYIKEILKKEFLPHLGQSPDDVIKKYYFLGYMVKNLLDVYLKRNNIDDRDSYSNKRISTPGILMANLFRQYFSKVVKDMKTQINKEFNNGSWRATNNIVDLINVSNIYKIIKYNIIATGLKYSLATGNWGIKNMPSKQGIAQVLSRLTYNSTLSHLRRVNTPIEKNGKFVGPRKLHSTQIMIMCPCETPEGASIGIVKNLSIGTVISNYVDSNHILDIIKNLDFYDIKTFDIKTNNMSKMTKIFINGNWIGFTREPYDMNNKLIELRRQGIIDIHTSLAWNIFKNTFYINTDAGRCLRPLYIIENNKFNINNSITDKLNKKLINWDHLIVPQFNSNISQNKSCIEFLDVEESNFKMISMTQNKLKESINKVIKYRYTHCELHPCMMLGVLGSVIPFAEHNQAPRNLFQSAMGKQAMGIYVTNFKERTDSLAHILHYPQIPIVDSKIVKALPSHNLPCGLNAIVAIASFSGYNQEDSLIINKDAVKRGLFVSTFYRTYKVEEKKSQASGEDERFCKPDFRCTKGMKMGNYDKLNPNGFMNENERVDENDIIIGKVMRSKFKQNTFNNEFIYKDNSQIVRPNETGYVDKVILSRNGDGYRFGKVKIRSVREPVIGDKHSSRHGQKGTIGMMFNQEDMPFTEEGITPDLIMNPHAVPSRMTIGQLKEKLLGKACCIQGKYGDATPFTNINVSDLESILQDECGFHKHGHEVLYNGATGQQLKADIYIGPTFYQRLKHMVNDKIHSRSNGPMVTLTRQPAEGRSRDGGLRLGEMEKDCMLGHGASSFLKEILMDKSDNFKMYICKRCGMIAVLNKHKKLFGCKKCENFTDITEVRVPYACKLFIQELEAMAISPRLITNNCLLEDNSIDDKSR